MVEDVFLPLWRETDLGQIIFLSNDFVFHSTQRQEECAEYPCSVFTRCTVKDEWFRRFMGNVQEDFLIRRWSTIQYVGVCLCETLI